MNDTISDPSRNRSAKPYLPVLALWAVGGLVIWLCGRLIGATVEADNVALTLRWVLLAAGVAFHILIFWMLLRADRVSKN